MFVFEKHTRRSATKIFIFFCTCVCVEGNAVENKSYTRPPPPPLSSCFSPPRNYISLVSPSPIPCPPPPNSRPVLKFKFPGSWWTGMFGSGGCGDGGVIVVVQALGSFHVGVHLDLVPCVSPLEPSNGPFLLFLLLCCLWFTILLICTRFVAFRNRFRDGLSFEVSTILPVGLPTVSMFPSWLLCSEYGRRGPSTLYSSSFLPLLFWEYLRCCPTANVPEPFQHGEHR